MLERDSENVNDRKLGDLWEGWDGNLDAVEPEIPGPKSRFFFHAAFGLAFVLGFIGFLYYMIYPRLYSFGDIPMVIVETVFVIIGGLLALFFISIVAAMIIPLKPVGTLALLGMSFIRPIAFASGWSYGVSDDRMSASTISVHNAITRASGSAKPPAEVLVLLPRCLSKDAMREAKAAAEEFGCKAAIAGGGGIARKLIAQHKPKAIIALACERDLLSGLKFVGTKIDTFALPNKRPSGPCKDTRFDSARFREMIEFFAGPKVKK
jgi:uncharacterized protein